MVPESEAEASLISEGVNKGTQWFCHVCKLTLNVKTMGQQAQTAEKKPDAISHSIRELSAKIENSHNSNWPKKSYNRAIKSHTDTIGKTIDEKTNNMKGQQILLQQTLDETDAESRKVNAIIHNVKETPNTAIMDQGKEFMMDECFLHTSVPVLSSMFMARK